MNGKEGSMDNSMHPPLVTRRRFVAIAGAAAAASFLGRGEAAYATTWTGFRTKTISGVTYTYRAGVDPGPGHKAHASVLAKPAVGSSQLGVKAMLYNAAGLLVASSGWRYGNGSSVSAAASKSFLGGARGSGAFITKKGSSQVVTIPAAKTSRSGGGFRVSESGETFGSLADAAIPPDFVSALTMDGKEGFVRSETLLEADSGEEIDVFDATGTVRIGFFRID